MNQVVENIAHEIKSRGAIPFARFMELALYCPVYGYYEKEEDTIGRRGDFFTSVSVGSLFGELLGYRFGEWLEEIERAQVGKSGGPPEIVEAGAHDGRLAGDILGWLREHRAELFARVEYWIVEPSQRQQARQRKSLAQFGNVHWTPDLAGLSAAKRGRCPCRVIFANELLDALPLHRVGWDAERRTWFEWGVGLSNGDFAWERLPNVSPSAADELSQSNFDPDLLAVLPSGYVIEICPAAAKWWRQAAETLVCGKLLAIDYGLTAEELFMPERKEGTLRAYHQHRSIADVLARAGEQDITAHVNFGALQKAGESLGLRTEAFETQGRFLASIAARIMESKSAFGEWTGPRNRQLRTLTHPNHLGQSFRILLQSRGCPAPYQPPGT